MSGEVICVMNALKTLREERGISQQLIAAHIGTTQQSIHRYEHGLYEPDLKTVMQIADFFDVSVDYLIGHTDIRHKYEKIDQYELNETEAHLVDTYRTLSTAMRQHLLNLLCTLAEVEKK